VPLFGSPFFSRKYLNRLSIIFPGLLSIDLGINPVTSGVGQDFEKVVQRIRFVLLSLSRLSGRSKLADTVTSYLGAYIPLFNELAERCNTTNDVRKLDKALFSYGAFEKGLFLAALREELGAQRSASLST